MSKTVFGEVFGDVGKLDKDALVGIEKRLEEMSLI